MSVHVPLSTQAQTEARILMLSSNNLRSPASGKVLTVPSQDMVFGVYYLTSEKTGEDAKTLTFASFEDALLAIEANRDLDKKFKVEENVQNCTIFKTVVTICMNKKYLLFNKPEIGLSSLDIRKLSDILIGNFKRNGYTPIIHSKNVNYFFDYLDYIIIIKDKKVALFESREKLEKMVYSISGSVDLISTAVKDRDVLAIRTLKNFSKLKIAYVLAKDEDEIRAHGSRTVSLLPLAAP